MVEEGRSVKEGEVKDAGEKDKKPHGSSQEDDEEFLISVQGCLEELMSRANLEEDLMIQQHINAHMYVPLYILAAHPKVVTLGPAATMKVLLTAGQRSEALNVDHETMMISPVIKYRRNTLILRDLPDGISEQELRDLFKSSPQLNSISSMKPDVNNTAYVACETDEAAQELALWLRSQKLRGSSVKCAMKSDHFMRSFFPAQPASMHSQSPAGSWPASPWTGPSSWPSPLMGPSYENSSQMWAASGWDAEEKGKGMKGGKKGKSKGKGKGYGSPDDAEALAAEAQRRLEQAIFGPQAGAGEEGDIGEVDVGYTHEFRRYTKQQIVDICSSVEVVTKPDSFVRFEKEHKDAGLFSQTPLKDWAPPPTPMTTFAASMLDVGNRRSGAGSAGADELEGYAGDAQNRRHSRPGRKASGSWTRNKSARNESGEYEGGRSGEWNDWEWPASGGAGWGPEPEGGKGKGKGCRKRASSRSKRSSWDDWYGQTWVEKQPSKEPGAEGKEDKDSSQPSKDPAAEGKEDKEPSKPTWAEKLRGVPDKSRSTTETAGEGQS
mmetsp:Transcript_118531/g.377818  ORF Transcript_118531/g.377818 Transcript_118531/m.377818 type:complete len:550 (+) Transcript_118531:168-1817(+)